MPGNLILFVIPKVENYTLLYLFILLYIHFQPENIILQHQLWYDDSLFLELKYDLGIQKNLKGIGIEALGYDGNRNELWNLIEKKFVNLNNVDDEKVLPEEFVLYQNYPNPFNPETVIIFNLSVDGFIDLRIYDLLGREIATLLDEFKPAGKYYIKFSTNDFQLTSGLYFYKLSLNGTYSIKKMLVLK